MFNWICDGLMLAAIKAVEAGVAGIVVSNHGARQLDYTPATISILEEVTQDLLPASVKSNFVFYL